VEGEKMPAEGVESVYNGQVDHVEAEVVHLTQEEYEAAAEAALADAGVTFDDLATRARRNELGSGYLQALWYAVRGLAPQS
jgi:hypothetical protein